MGMSQLMSLLKNEDQINRLMTDIADVIYARRCSEHRYVLCDCPCLDDDVVRSISPNCGQWCSLLKEPVAFLDNTTNDKEL